ncbi:MAG: M14/M99 family metallopeptidase [Thermodesulfobacteriota bacterium]
MKLPNQMKSLSIPLWRAGGFLVGLFLLLTNPAAAQKTHKIYFEGTDHELHVYRSIGREQGKTLMLIGGIQGDEPGGFLSADLYADFSLLKGSLIVVPRANFQSIVLNRRQINEDMNRKFGDDRKDNYETRVVEILKQLIAESDLLLNLHDGSGFFSEKWESPDRNPLRYGQSIIADCDVFLPVSPKGTTIHLGEMAREVAARINSQIPDQQHHFHFNNHRTHERDTLHKEQRRSATYYALYTCGIPAFGIETSKALPLEEQVRQHNLAINVFMETMGIRPESPGIRLDPPELRYLTIAVNDSLPVLLENRQTLHIRPGDRIMIMHIAANYERGLCADIEGSGTMNDTRKPVIIQRPTRIVVRKDHHPCGHVHLAFGEPEEQLPAALSAKAGPGGGRSDYLFFRLRINGEERTYGNNDCVKLVKGDVFEIINVISGTADPSELVVNFKGFVGDTNRNQGEDRGYVIDTAKDLWTRYSLDRRGGRYQVVVESGQRSIGTLMVELEEPTLDYIVLKTENNTMQCIVPGGTAWIDGGKPVRLMDIITNVHQNHRVSAFLAGPNASRQLLKMDDVIPLTGMTTYSSNGEYRLEILRDRINIGSVYFKNIPGDAS